MNENTGMKAGMDLEFDEIAGNQEVAEYLEALAKDLRAGKVSFDARPQGITLTTEGEITLQIGSERKLLKNVVTMSLTWTTPVMIRQTPAATVARPVF
jgi:amphi-Trp domain-containing protein